MNKNPFSELLLNQYYFTREEFEKVISLLSPLDTPSLKRYCALYAYIYERVEGYALCAGIADKLVKNSVIKKYSILDICEIEAHYKGRQEERKFAHLPYGTENDFYFWRKELESMTDRQVDYLLMNSFMIHVLLDVELLKVDPMWKPQTDYAMILHYEYFINI